MFLVLVQDTMVPDYNDIVDYSLTVKLEDVDFSLSMYKLDYNSYYFGIIEYDSEEKPELYLQGTIHNKDLIKITEQLNMLDIDLISDRNDTSGGHEYIIVQSDRVTNGSASQGSDHVKNNIVCYDNIPDELRTQVAEFRDFIVEFAQSKDLNNVLEVENSQNQSQNQ